jgi:hypothetical protein
MWEPNNLKIFIITAFVGWITNNKERTVHVFKFTAIYFFVLFYGSQTSSCLAELRSNVKILKIYVLYFLFKTRLTTLAVARTRGGKSRANKFFFLRWRIIFMGHSVRNFLHFTLLTSRILMWLLNFWNICTSLAQTLKLYHPILRLLMTHNYNGSAKQRSWPNLRYCPGIFLHVARLFYHVHKSFKWYNMTKQMAIFF